VRIALDTNFLVYAEGVNGADRKAIATQVLTSFAAEEIVLPVQALGELFTVLTRKAGWPADQARAAVLGWHGAFRAVDTSSQVLLEAMELAARHQLSLWDAIMLAAAAQAGCRVLLSEDMQDSFSWRGVTVRNPFMNAPRL
jgi:predicted nucleic acid-binding protein